MNDDRFFRISFVVVFATVSLIRLYFHLRAKTFGANVYSPAEASLTSVLRLVLGIPFMCTIALYILAPRLVAWAYVELPSWVRVAGLLVSAAALVALVWIHSALGENF